MLITRLLAFAVVSSLPLAASAQNSREFKALAIPASACETVLTEFVGDSTGGRLASGNVTYVQAPGGGTAMLHATCPIPLSNVRVAGSGSPQLAKFCVYYHDFDAAGTGSRVFASVMKGSIFPGANFVGSGSVQCNVDLKYKRQQQSSVHHDCNLPCSAHIASKIILQYCRNVICQLWLGHAILRHRLSLTFRENFP